MSNRCNLSVLLLVAAMSLTWGQQETSKPLRSREHGPSPEIAMHQHVATVEIYRLRIVNDVKGAITASRDGGKSWTVIGHVLTYTEKVSRDGYTASKWAPMSAIAATAVNAIHIRTGYNANQDRGVVFSVVPLETSTEEGKELQARLSYLSPDSTIYTDMPAGTGIFGGDWAPILGNPVLLETSAGLTPFPLNAAPRKGDVLVIPVLQPVDSPQAFIFENRFGGFITELGWDGKQTVIGQVLKPVCGVGRFTGARYADVGRLRANHNGVIDIGLAHHGETAGFQIIPREHAMSPEMERARTFTQWMVIGPLDARDPSWEGTAPLFLNYLRPSYAPDDYESPDWLKKITSRVLIDCRINGGPWTAMPHFSIDPDMNKPLPAWAMTALVNVTHIRILLPVPEKGVGG